jgi:hypothetical protein
MECIKEKSPGCTDVIRHAFHCHYVVNLHPEKQAGRKHGEKQRCSVAVPGVNMNQKQRARKYELGALGNQKHTNRYRQAVASGLQKIPQSHACRNTSVTDVWQKRNCPGTFDGGCNETLVARTVAGEAAGKDLSPAFRVAHEQFYVLIVNIISLLFAETAEFFTKNEAFF